MAATAQCTDEKKAEQTDKSMSSLRRRTVLKKFAAHSQREGAGFIVHRPIGGRYMSSLESDPFLMLDELGPVDYAKGEFEGAPWHPHRGFDTVMYVKEGEGTHQDSMGNKGTLKAGDCQWMTAGSGIVHDEGRDHPGGTLHGFQMWVNLPAKHKMTDPQYQQITAKNFPFLTVQKGVLCKVIVGKIKYFDDSEKVWKEKESPMKPIVPINYFDINLLPEGDEEVIYRHVIPQEARKQFKTAIVYVYGGAGLVANGSDAKGQTRWTAVKRTDTLRLSEDGDFVEFKCSPSTSSSSSSSKKGQQQKEGLKFLLLFGAPIREPIAWRGPFVMNTQEEIRQCFVDYRNGKLATVRGKSFVY